MDPTRLRTRAAWLIALPFLWYARPTLTLVWIGALVSASGLLVRGWAAGVIDKHVSLATSGPYAFVRNPLYLGSLLTGLGLGLAGGHWVWPLLFAAFFLAFYPATARREAERLEARHGTRYREYREAVPGWVPRLTPMPDAHGDASEPFRWRRYAANREWEAAVGAVAAFVLLVLKAVAVTGR